MKVSLFDFSLPPDRIAHSPVSPRDSAKLLHVGDSLRDLHVRDLPSLLSPGDLLVFNDSRVIPARLFAPVNGKQIEVLLHQARGGGLWSAFARPAKKLKPGMVLEFAPAFTATVEGRDEEQVRLRFADPENLFNQLHQHGHVPLPPYIDRPDRPSDRQDYQTIYATRDGSVAAPTAGLHFTPQLMEALEKKGIGQAFVTLHVGAGTFQPVKAQDTDQHRMHSEWIEISSEAANAINAVKAAGGKIIAVGTTSLRILESVADEHGVVKPYAGETDIFITPGYHFKAVDRLLTNFHLPKSTLFMLVAAFAGLERMQAAYAHAIGAAYRFYSYGDANLLEINN